MNILILINYGLLAFIAGIAITLAFHYKNKYQDNAQQTNCLLNDLEEMEYQAEVINKRVKELEEELEINKEQEDFIDRLKKININLEIENFTLKQKPVFKVGAAISENVKIIAITPVKNPITSLLKCFSHYKTLENFEYIYTLKHDHGGPAYKVPEREILKATPEPTKEEIFSVESFE